MGLVFEGRFAANDVLLDYDLRDLEVVAGPQGSLLYAVNGQNGGLSVFTLDATGIPQLIDSLYHRVSGLGVGTFDLGADNLLTLGGTRGDRLVQYQIEQDGSLSSRPDKPLPGASPDGLGVLITVELDLGHSAVYASGTSTGSGATLMGWHLDSAGQVVSAVATAGSDASYALSGSVVMAATSSQILLVADDSGLGLRSFGVDAHSGALSLLDTFGPTQGLGVNIPTALQVCDAFGSRWVILGAAGSSSVSLLQLAEDGSLSLQDHLIDTLQTRFAGVTALEVVQVEEHVFVLAAGRDNGMSLFRLAPGGQLIHVQSLIHNGDLGLQNITALEAAVIGDQLQFFVSSERAAGIACFSIDLDSLGAVAQISDSGTVLAGTSGDDVLVGQNTQSTLHGAAGDDLLLAGLGGGVLNGGAGADIFVLRPAGDPLVIEDFEPGQDQIDMSYFPGLRNPGQLQVQTLPDGIQLQWGDTEITLHSADGTPLTLQDLWPNGFAVPDRVQLGETLPAGTYYGTSGADVLNGTVKHDQIRGRAGNDTLNGEDGNDQLWGGTGRDLLNGGQGQDRLWGRAGHDDLKGGGGNDQLQGGAGQDILAGAQGQDSLAGNGGADQLFGNRGGDHLHGNAGRDVLVGGRGDDQLTGGAGRDVFVFGRRHGRDSITDFTPSSDHIDLSTLGGGVDRFGDLKLRQRGDDVLIVTGEGKIWIEDLQRNDLSADDFIF